MDITEYLIVSFIFIQWIVTIYCINIVKTSGVSVEEITNSVRTILFTSTLITVCQVAFLIFNFSI